MRARRGAAPAGTTATARAPAPRAPARRPAAGREPSLATRGPRAARAGRRERHVPAARLEPPQQAAQRRSPLRRGTATAQTASRRGIAQNPRAMAGQAYLDDVWDAVPEGAEPELFALRRDFLLAHVEPGRRVLDVGCGEGAFSAALAEAGARPIAVDVADEPLRRLRARFPQLDRRPPRDRRRAAAARRRRGRRGRGPARSSSTSSTSARSATELRRVLRARRRRCSSPRPTTRAPCSPASPLSPRAFDEHFAPVRRPRALLHRAHAAHACSTTPASTTRRRSTRPKGHLLACAS